MEKIIRGKRYNTETATEVCDNWNNFDDVYETLYTKRSGEFFLHYIGGPLSKYAIIYDDGSRSGDEGIEPLTEAQAQKFCEKYGDAKTYEKYFTVEEDDTVKISVRLTAANEKKIKKIAVERRVTLSKLFNDIIEQL